MKIEYILSGGQVKDLLVRKTEIRIALPVPLTEEPDLLSWARAVLPADIRHMVVSAGEREVSVAVRHSPQPRTLQDLIGPIVQDDRGPQLQLAVIVVEVHLRPAAFRRVAKQLQWPARVQFGDTILPWRQS